MRALMAALAATALIAAGCGSDDEATSEATTTTPSENSTTTTAASASSAAACSEIDWDISPGAFSGGDPIPAQLYGSYGPGEQQTWTQEDGPGDSQGGINEIVAAPNGVQMIRWGEGSPLDGKTTVECSLGWGCFDDDLTYGWENGIIYDLTDGEDVVFPHIWKLSEDDSGTRQLEVWEIKLSPDDDAMAAIDQMRQYIEGDTDSIDWDMYYIKAPDMDGGIPTVDEKFFDCDGTTA